MLASAPVVRRVLALLFAVGAHACAPAPAAPPETGRGAEASAGARGSAAPLPYARAFPTARALASAPAGCRWSSAAEPADPTWTLLLAPPAREAWSRYATLSPSERTLEAFVGTMNETQPACTSLLQCTAEARMRLAYAVQGWHQPATLFEWQEELWVHAGPAGPACAARVPQMRGDEDLRAVVAGVCCGDRRQGAAPATRPDGAEGWHRFAPAP